MKYRNLIIEDINQPAKDADIESFEIELGEKLPEDYKEFLRICNGGYLEYDILIDLNENSSEYLCFSSLYSVSGEPEWGCNPFEFTQARKQEGFPDKGIFPIASDGGSSMLYLDLRDGCKIVAFVQGLPAWTGLRQEDLLVVVANSFNDYIDKLTISDEMIKDHIEGFEVTEASVNSTIDWFDSIGVEWRVKFGALWNDRVPFKQV